MELTIIVAIIAFLAVTLLLVGLLLFAKAKLTSSGEVTIDINGGEKVITTESGSTLLATLANNKVFLPSACGGAGMAPMRSHLMHLFKTEKTKRPVSFWYGARALKEAPYVDEFHAIEKEFPNFKFNLALDRPDPEADAAGVKYTPGFVHNVLYENYLKNHQAPEDCIYLMCGPPMMIASVVKMLDDLGVPSENILYDNFGS